MRYETKQEKRTTSVNHIRLQLNVLVITTTRDDTCSASGVRRCQLCEGFSFSVFLRKIVFSKQENYFVGETVN
ncbi:unnamed protein product [Acanthoscelides obtectus]|uniref:Uncharacterized protein n=1 Tax=Acanthoscelides obtectus TaxID=200917 RepID=A0A9P0L2V7_ACAOB|nr:unnamed protein product [Acanthoscelides obtectus]CAK1629564.1 hypothetical protein AOBTE_LOCUS5817 [Acanthoscelides obtectus]